VARRPPSQELGGATAPKSPLAPVLSATPAIVRPRRTDIRAAILARWKVHGIVRKLPT
jgi:hypothetical protein